MIRIGFAALAAAGLLALTAGTAAARAPQPNGPQEEVKHSFDRRCLCRPANRCASSIRLGSITVRTHSSRDVHVLASIRVAAASHDDAENFANQIQIHVEPSSSGLLVRTDYPEQNNSWWNHRNISFSVEYEIEMPEDAPLTIRNSFGNVSVYGLKAATDIDNKQGTVTVHDGKGNQLLRDSFGAVELINNDGDADVGTNNGSVQVSQIHGALTVNDRFGSVNAGNITRTVSINNSNGTVEVHQAGGPSTIRNSFGSVTVSDITGDLTVRNGNGAVDARNITGAADLQTSFASLSFLNVHQRVDLPLLKRQHFRQRRRRGRLRFTRASPPSRYTTSAARSISRTTTAKFEARDIRGPLQVRTSFAGVEASGIHGDLTINATNSAIELSQIEGSVQAEGSFGKVDISGVRRGVRVVTGNAGVSVVDAGGETYIKTTFGLVRAERINGSLTVEDSNGSVKATTIHGAASVRTSFGSVALTRC